MLITYIAAAILVISGYLALVRQYQMLQQNSYFASRYLGWIKSSFSPLSFILRGILAGLTVWACFLKEGTLENSLIVFSAGALYFGWRAFAQNSASIKKLVFTARIKRMLAFSTAFLVALSADGLLIGGKVESVLLALLVVLVLFPEALCFISLFALKPIEKLISNHYINDAKRLLSSVKGIQVIGITGSYGKTGTKYILSRILSEKYNILHTPESYNTTMGVVRTIREKLRADDEIFVCEMGAKNIGDIKEICDVVHPDHALITSVGPQHLETFKTIENVYKTKFELADAVKEKGGFIFANGDNAVIRDNAGLEVTLYGTDKAQSFRAENITADRTGSVFDLVLHEERIQASTKLLGRHNVLNIVGAASLAYKLGVAPKQIAFAISRLNPVEHRLELKGSVSGSLLIDDAYNSNPEGCLEAVSVLGSFEGMKKVIITPGLVELGEKEYECNKALGAAAAKVCDKLIFVGLKRSEPLVAGAKEAGYNEQNIHIVPSFRDAMEVYSSFADKNTVVLLENDLPDNYLK